jgi:hypothetical protein
MRQSSPAPTRGLRSSLNAPPIAHPFDPDLARSGGRRARRNVNPTGFSISQPGTDTPDVDFVEQANNTF